MTTATILFLGLRALHVLAAAIWIGSATFLAVVVIPAIEASGPPGGQVMTRLTARLGAHMGVFSIVSVLSGIYLLWRFTGGFDGGVLATHGGRAFSIGGGSGILALIVGVIIGRTAERLVEAAAALGKASDEAARQALGRQLADLRGRMATLVRIVIVLQAIALVLMAVGHYI
jgi:uncharacterized membrane protein